MDIDNAAKTFEKACFAGYFFRDYYLFVKQADEARILMAVSCPTRGVECVPAQARRAQHYSRCSVITHFEEMKCL